MPTKVTYLFGAGASEGEVRYYGASKSILMQDIVEEIAIKIGEDNIAELKDVRNDLVSGVNIEQLITLCEVAGTGKHATIAKKLRELFRKTIEKRIDALGDAFYPLLFASLIDMHNVIGLNEQIVAIMTTNYEDFIERAMQKVENGINLAISTDCKGSGYRIKKNLKPILKLHGSFNWKNEYPITVKTNIADDEDVLWVPPGVVKRKEFYPLNIIWGKAKELLACDVLRIIGSSLSRNDWDLVSLISITQRCRTDNKAPYVIELIDFPGCCDSIRHQYSYLKNVKSISEIEEIQDYITRNYFPDYFARHKPVPEDKIKEVMKGLDKENMFALWLRAKGEKLFHSGISLSTKGNYFERFVRSGLSAA